MKNKVVKSVVSVSVITLFIKIINFFREVLLAARFGTTYEVDSIIIASTIPLVLTGLIGVALNSVLIPIFTEKRVKELYNDLNLTSNKINTLLLIVCMILIVIMGIFPKVFILLIAPGISGKVLELSLYLFRIYLINILTITLICSYSAWFNGFKMFIVPNISNLLVNIPSVIYLICNRYPKIELVAVYTVIGYLLQLLFLIVILNKNKYEFKLSSEWCDEENIKIFKKSMPAFLGSGVNQINTIIDRIQGSILPQGSISSLGYAYRLSNILIGLLITPITTISYPTLVELYIKENKKVYCEYVSSIIISISIITLPFVSILLLFNREIITIIYGRGMFNNESIEMTAILTIYISIGVFFICVREFLYKVFYSRNEINIAFKDGIIAMIVNIIFNILLTPIIKVNGLALATTLAAIISAIRLSILFNKEEKEFSIIKVYIKIFKIFILTFILAIISKLFYHIIDINSLIIKFSIILFFYSITTVIGVVIILPEVKKFLLKFINKK